jgi:hypothetical protein
LYVGITGFVKQSTPNDPYLEHEVDVCADLKKKKEKTRIT